MKSPLPAGAFSIAIEQYTHLEKGALQNMLELDLSNSPAVSEIFALNVSIACYGHSICFPDFCAEMKDQTLAT